MTPDGTPLAVMQVAEAFHTYAKHLRGVRVLPVYGGQPMQRQLSRLRAGVHVVVGTPGRILDHLRRRTLDLSALATVVLDEADEMLRMGFIEDVEWILSQAPEGRQTALFSATMTLNDRARDGFDGIECASSGGVKPGSG